MQECSDIQRALERVNFHANDTVEFCADGFLDTAPPPLRNVAYRTEAMEVLLAHRERKTMKAAYNRAKYLVTAGVFAFEGVLAACRCSRSLA